MRDEHREKKDEKITRVINTPFNELFFRFFHHILPRCHIMALLLIATRIPVAAVAAVAAVVEAVMIATPAAAVVAAVVVQAIAATIIAEVPALVL